MNEKKRQISWMISNSCNEHCKSCYMPWHVMELSKNDQFKLQDKLIENNAEAIFYAAAEPLRLEHLPELMKGAHSRGLLTRLNTNGILLHSGRFEKIKPHVDEIVLPFDSLDDGVNEQIRGNKYHRQIIQDRINMISNAENIDLFINTLVTRQNISLLDELGGYLNEQNIQRWKLRQFYPIRERAMLNQHQFEIPGQDFLDVTEKLTQKYSKINIVARGIDAIENDRIKILPNGDAFRSKNRQDIGLGNVLDGDFRINW